MMVMMMMRDHNLYNTEMIGLTIFLRVNYDINNLSFSATPIFSRFRNSNALEESGARLAA